MFKDFGKRLQRDVKGIVDGRIAGSEEKSGSLMKVSYRLLFQTQKLTLSESRAVLR